MSGVSPGPSQAEPENLDLFCLHCGYNLRGLSGDPRRCPECGNLNPVGDLVVPAVEILGQLRAMETGPAFCMLCLLSLLWAIVFCFVAETSRFSGSSATCTWVVIIAAIPGWILSAAHYRKSCIGKPDCWMALWKYHMYGLVAFGVFFGPIVIVFWLLDAVFLITKVGFLACVFAAAVFSLYGVRWAYRRASEDMRRLQREVAAQMARDYHRRRLGRRHSWFKGRE